MLALRRAYRCWKRENDHRDDMAGLIFYLFFFMDGGLVVHRVLLLLQGKGGESNEV